METADLIRSFGLISPKTVTIMITNGCNLQCRHCWPDSQPAHRVQPVAPATIKKAILEFVGIGAESLILTGGEPLTHPDFFEILQSACKTQELNEIQVQTNAVLLSDAVVDKLRGLACDKLSFQVSLEGATPTTNDLVRGDGSFKSALAGIQRLLALGFRDRTRIAFTETRQNFSDIPALMKLLESLGIGDFNSGTLVMNGRAEALRSLDPPTPDQYRDLIRLFQEDGDFRERYQKNFGFNIAALEWSLDKPEGDTGCRFMEHCLISSDGILYPCPLFQFDHYGAHSLFVDSLDAVLKNILPLWSKLQKLSRHRGKRLKECQKCPGRDHCNGGCMGRACAASGNLISLEDRCPQRRAVYDELHS